MDIYRLRLFVITFSSIVTQISIVGGKVLVHYNGNNYMKCPSGSYQVEFSSNCTDNCPPNAPFTVFDLCLDFCPVGLSYTCNKYNTINNTAATQPGKTPIFQCPKGFCPKERPFCFDYRCLSDCPHDMVREDFSCVYHCSNTTSMVYNKSCVTECPQNYPYSELGICVSNCSPYNILYGNVCVRDCPGNMFRFNKTCVTSCPSQAPFHFEALYTKFCLESCPDFSFIDRLVCKLKCPEGWDFLWNGTCVKTCPDSAPIIYVLKKRVPQFEIPICITSCPDDTFFDGVSCVETCDRHMYVYNSTCVDHCPASHSLLEGNTSPFYCVSQCRNNENLNGNRCTAKCPGNKFVFNRTCVSECPISSPLVYHQKCFSQCPYNYLNESGKCVDYCSMGRFIFNAFCVESCPETHRYIINRKCYKSCSDNNMLLWNNSCVHSCPKQATNIFNHTCLSVCPLSHPFTKSGRTSFFDDLKYYCVASCNDSVSSASFRYDIECKCSAHLLSYNSTCVEKCPTPYNFNLKGECHKRCPNYMPGYNNTCGFSCPIHANYIYDGLCTEMCPLSHQYHVTRPRDNNATYCFEKCGVNIPERFSYNLTCVMRCPNTTVLIGSKCIEQCPIDTSMLYKKEDGKGKYMMICVKNCPGTTFTRGKNCYDQCPEHLASYLPTRTCLKQCPNHSRFRYRFRTNGNTFSYRCKSSCDKFIFDSNICVNVCPHDTPFVFKQTCVPKCPETHMFYAQQTNLCLAACKPPLVEFNNTCRRSCPSSFPFVMSNTCVEKCPNQFNMTSPFSKGHVCARACIYPFVQENNTCINACKGKFIVNNVCRDIIGCPNEYKYIEKSSRGTICRKICQKNEFVFKDLQCTKKCPTFSAGNQCVENCPKTHPYTLKQIFSFDKDSTCYSTCPKFTHDKFCVDYCPSSYLLIMLNNTCVTQCPSGTFRIYPDNKCIPVSLGILLVALLLTIGISCLFGVYSLFRRNKFCRHKIIEVENNQNEETCVMKIAENEQHHETCVKEIETDNEYFEPTEENDETCVMKILYNRQRIISSDSHGAESVNGSLLTEEAKSDIFLTEEDINMSMRGAEGGKTLRGAEGGTTLRGAEGSTTLRGAKDGTWPTESVSGTFLDYNIYRWCGDITKTDEHGEAISTKQTKESYELITFDIDPENLTDFEKSTSLDNL